MSERLLVHLACLLAIATTLWPGLDWMRRSSTTPMAALLGVLGCYGLFKLHARGRFSAGFGGLAFIIIVVTPLWYRVYDVVALFAAGGIVWCLTRTEATRIAHILAVLFSVTAGAWGVSAFSPDEVPAATEGLRHLAASLVGLSLLVAMTRIGPDPERDEAG